MTKIDIKTLSFLFALCCSPSLLLAQKAEVIDNKFAPMLLNVEVNTDMLMAGDELVVKAYWQNVGAQAASEPLECFLELEFGYQRTLENTNKNYRYIWNPYPDMAQWKSNEIHAVAYRMDFPECWGGEYKLFLGIVDKEHVPIDVIGENKKDLKRIHIGNVSKGWGWGIARIELTRKSWSKEFNKPSACMEANQTTDHIEIGSTISASFSKSTPGIIKVKNAEELHLIKPLIPEVVLRDYINDKVIYSYNEDVFIDYSVKKVKDDFLTYTAIVKYQGEKISEFELKANIENRSIIFTLGDTWEAKDFELLEIKMYSLFSTSNADANIVSFLGGGRLIPLDSAYPMGFCSEYDTRNAVGVFDKSGMVVLESTCLDDKLYTMVDETNLKKTAIVGASLTNRICAKNQVRSVQVPNVHHIEINFLSNEWGEPGWMGIAKYLRKDLKGRGRELYKNSIFSLYYCTGGPEPEPWQIKEDSPYAITRLNQGIKFNEILEIEKNYSNLLDGYKQITKLYGWFRDQEDDRTLIGFPSAAISGVDHRAGTMEELQNVLENSRKYNVITQFYDHYDNFYYSKRNDPAIVAMDAEGKPWKGWIWAEGQSYIIGQRKYWEMGLVQERVKKTIDMFGIKDMTHFDVLSSEVLRYDFDPDYPASAQTSYRYKLKIVELYNQYGIEVSSESLTHPFVGHITYAYHTRMNPDDHYFKGEKFIPLVSAVYHGTIQFNKIGSEKERDILKSMVLGAHYGFELDRESYEQVKMIYIQNMPMNKLYDEKWESYTEDNRSYLVSYTNNSYVKVDEKNNTYEIAYKGRIIGKNWTTFIEGVKPDSYLAYSLNGGEMCYNAPEGWNDSNKLKAIILTKKGDGETIPCKIRNGVFSINMPINTPVRIVKD